MRLQLAYSPCPNDTFTYYGIMSGKISLADYPLEVHHHDIETLNRLALAGTYEITKMSFPAWLKLKNKYRLLTVGNALGFGCGPILIAKDKKIKSEDLPKLRIALPGEQTTANLLFSLYCPEAKNKIFTTYDQVFSALHEGQADCGVVIHESRFLFPQAGFYKLCDLGEWWEATTGSPIPLGAVGIRSDVPLELDSQVENIFRKSLNLAAADPQLAMPYIKKMAVEMNDEVIQKHIKMFVNDLTYDLGETGRKAINKLEAMAKAAGIIA
ncbi:1,4-dihydroxy-6-naphthoate synthase [Candidatus Saganbacteria bacterium]|nr:1,4-dihydroxy-6-naphthoate synthase [Candidatus Saganbacteria bacterium]